MMKLKIEIVMDNSAFDPLSDGGRGNEAARILRAAADKLDGRDLISTGDLFPLADVNGNWVGEAKVTR